MKKIFVLQHESPIDEDVKFIGVYSKKRKAKRTIKRLSKQPGFKNTTKGFHISKYKVDKDHWVEGYITA